MVVGQAQAELAVYLGLVGGVGVTQDGWQAAERFDDGPDLFLAHPAVVSGLVGQLIEAGLGCFPFGLDFPAPGGDEGGVGAGFQGSAVAGQLPVAVGQRAAGGFGWDVGVGLGFFERGQGVPDALWGEGFGEPVVEWVE